MVAGSNTSTKTSGEVANFPEPASGTSVTIKAWYNYDSRNCNCCGCIRQMLAGIDGITPAWYVCII